jgi:PAS domain S-box-containing protein
MLIEDLHVGVLILGPRAEIQFANQAALDICGMTAKQVLGKTTQELGLTALREDEAEVLFSMRPGPRAASGNAVRNEVTGFRRPGTGEIVWIYGSSIPQFDGDGSVQRIIATLTDITDRKSMEAALETASELNRQILLSVQEGIVVHDRELRYELWNPFMERMTGLASRDVLGKHPLDVLPFLGESGAYAHIERALQGEVSSSLDIPYSVPETGQAGRLVRWGFCTASQREGRNRRRDCNCSQCDRAQAPRR